MHLRRGQKNLLVGVGVLILTYFFVSFSLRSNFLQRHLIGILERATHWKISFHTVDVSPIRGLVRLEDIDIEDTQKKVHIQVEHFLVNFSPLSVIRGKLILSDVILDHPTVDIVMAEKAPETKKNISFDVIQKIFQQFEKSFFLQNLILENVSLHNLEIRDNHDHEYLLEKAHLSLAPTLFKEISADIFLEGLEGNLPAFDRILAKLSLNSQGLQLDYLEIVSEKLILHATAHTEGNEKKGIVNLTTKIEIPHTLSNPINISLESEILNKVAHIKKLEASLESGQLTGSGSFAFETQKYELSFSAKEVSLESIFSKFPSIVLGPAKGLAEVEGKAEGQFPDIFVDSKATIHDLKHGPLFVKNAHGSLKLDWPVLSWDAEAKGGEDLKHEAHVVGAVEFLKSKETKKIQPYMKPLTVDIENGKLEDLLPTWKISGDINGNLRLNGTPQGFVEGTGHLAATNAQFLFEPIESLETELRFKPGGEVIFNKTNIQLPGVSTIFWGGDLTIKGDPENERTLFAGELTQGIKAKGYYEKAADTFKIESFQLQQGQNALDFSLTATGSENTSRINAQLKGTLDLEWLRFFPMYFHEGRGLAKVDLTCIGSSAAPQIKGEIKFSDNDILLRGFPEELHGLKGDLKIDAATILADLVGELGDGKFSLKGKMFLDHGKPSDVDVTFRGSNLGVSKNNVYRLEFDTDVTVKGKLPTPVLAGRLDIVEGRYIKPFVIRDLVLKPFEEESEPSSLATSLENMVLNLTIKNSGDLRVQNNVATLFLQSNLQINGTLGKPKISGALSVTEGTFRFLGRDFVINEGLVEFSNPVRSEPYLSISAQQEIPQDQPRYTVFVEVRGFMSNLAIQLSSSPSLEKQDIISLLAFGATQEEVRTEGLSRRTLTTGVIGEEVSTAISQPLAKTTRLDIFRLEASESGNLSRLSLGKRISDRFTLEFINDLDPQTAEKTFQADYYLTDNILLKGFRKSLLGFDPSYELNLLLRFRLH